MTFRAAIIWLFLALPTLRSQEILREDVIGLRVVGSLQAGVPVIMPGATVSVTLDVESQTVRDFRLRARHCDKNWLETASNIVNDPSRLTGKSPIPSSPTSSAVRKYGRTYAFTLPGGGLDPFLVSGNYSIVIFDQESGEEAARFRVIVAERNASSLVALGRRRIPLQVFPWSEAHMVSLTVSDEFLQEDDVDPMYLQLVRTIDVYKNREWYNPVRIDLDKLTESTWVEGLGTGTVKFVAGKIYPGNEYRSIDLRNAELYPAGTKLKSRDGSDVSRYFSQGKRDRNGASHVAASALLAEYESMQFDVWWQPDRRPSSIHVVGDFSFWRVDPEWRMHPTDDDGHYAAEGLLKRGVYDYQYVVDETDWVTLEGNSWETHNVYTAIIYYNDTQYGGYDRVVGAGQVAGNGEVKRRDTTD